LKNMHYFQFQPISFASKQTLKLISSQTRSLFHCHAHVRVFWPNCITLPFHLIHCILLNHD
jgi:hypothetical protein